MPYLPIQTSKKHSLQQSRSSPSCSACPLSQSHPCASSVFGTLAQQSKRKPFSLASARASTGSGEGKPATERGKEGMQQPNADPRWPRLAKEQSPRTQPCASLGEIQSFWLGVKVSLLAASAQPCPANTARAAQPTLAQMELNRAQIFTQEAAGKPGLFSVPPPFVPAHGSRPNACEKRRKGNTNQVADVGQVLVGEDGLSVQVRHMDETGQHWLGHLISQHWPFLVDISCTQGTVLIVGWYKLLPGGACPETTS